MSKLYVDQILSSSSGGGVLFSDSGSASTPSVSLGSTNKGFYNSDSNNIGVSINGIKVSEINSDGLLNGTLGTDYKNLIQTQVTTLGTVLTGTTTIPYDNTIPQITEGTQFLSLSITPKYINSILEIEYKIQASYNLGARIAAALFQVGNVNALSCSYTYALNAESKILTGKHRMISNSTSSQTFTIRCGGSAAGTVTINGDGGVQYYGGILNSYIMIKEYI